MRFVTALLTVLHAFAALNMWPSAAAAAPAATQQCLYPHESETREVKSLDGLWNFVRSPINRPQLGLDERWFERDLSRSRPTIAMPVPASYNDITTDRALREHVGTVWYDRRFFVSSAWREQRRVWLRFGSVHYAAVVWVNGVPVARHEIGHLPFQADVTDALLFGAENRVTVLCDNTLLADTVPQGKVVRLASDDGDDGEGTTASVQTYTFDFFNYAGIHRSVHLYTTPVLHIAGVQVDTEVLQQPPTPLPQQQQQQPNDDIENWSNVTATPATIMPSNVAPTGRIRFAVQTRNNLLAEALHSDRVNVAVRVIVYDRDDAIVANGSSDATPTEANGTIAGTVDIPAAKLWWPYLMSAQPGYLYTLEVRLVAVGIGAAAADVADEQQQEFAAAEEQDDGITLDVYRLRVGIRSLRWSSTQVLINDRPIYMRGFGKHEDADIRGKGLDLATMTRDFDLLRWIGANAYRTSHYPYSEESMQFADEAGIMVIDECPSVDTDGFTAALLHKHQRSLHELIVRDRNHASVVMWSIANEPRSQANGADWYFGAVAKYTRALDATRPLTAALAQHYAADQAGQHLDVIGFNRYNGWYSNAGRLDMVTGRVVQEGTAWHTKYNKPIMMLEYGADTMEGLHLVSIYCRAPT